MYSTSATEWLQVVALLFTPPAAANRMPRLAAAHAAVPPTPSFHWVLKLALAALAEMAGARALPVARRGLSSPQTAGGSQLPAYDYPHADIDLQASAASPRSPRQCFPTQPKPVSSPFKAAAYNVCQLDALQHVQYRHLPANLQPCPRGLNWI